jgi:hypothetical protein
MGLAHRTSVRNKKHLKHLKQTLFKGQGIDVIAMLKGKLRRICSGNGDWTKPADTGFKGGSIY